jgi:hypothetical protein
LGSHVKPSSTQWEKPSGIVRFVNHPGSNERGDTVELQPEYHQALLDALEKQGLKMTAYEKIGRKAGGISKSTTERFIKLRKVTRDHLKAFCDLAGFPYPIASVHHPDEARIVESLAAIREHRPDGFADILATVIDLKTSIDAELSAKARIRARLGRPRSE